MPNKRSGLQLQLRIIIIDTDRGLMKPDLGRERKQGLY